jgi:DNA-binding transcriptional regulator YiaG
MAKKTHHYIESGLDNVYLANGFTIHETPYGKGVSIQNTEGLNRAIGKWLISRPALLIGAELRFLRGELELTQRNLAGILGTTEQTLRLWEKNRGKPITGSADRLLRGVYAEFLSGNVQLRRMLERLVEFDRKKNEDAYFSKTNNSWKPLVDPESEQMKA